jgi:Domain of unknown function (DUF4261)
MMSEDIQGQDTEQAPDGFARTYGVELLYETRPQLPKKALFEALRSRCPDAVPLDGDLRTELLAFVHPGHPVQFGETALPAQCLIAPSEKALDTATAETTRQQSWQWPGAKEVLPRCRTSVLVTDLMSSGLEYGERLELFQRVLASVVEVAPCLAIHWRPTQQLVSPDDFRDAMKQKGYRHPLPGGINVRFYRIAGYGAVSEEGMTEDSVMDTLGLAALGLPDLQCHFRRLEPTAVSRVLYNTACYLFEKGPVIDNGHTVRGIESEDRWRCQYEKSLLAPERSVLDLNPGSLHAAGNRSDA